VVYGAGVHGCEMAQGLARAGVTVTLVEPGARVLADLPDDVAQLVVDSLHTDGVRMMTGVRLLSVAPTLDGGAWVGTDGGDVAAEAFVLATGRRARCSGLDLAAAGVTTGPAGSVVVDDRLRTGSPTVLACGEVTGLAGYGVAPGPMARVVAANATSRRGAVRFDAPAPARLTRTDPEVVLVGDPGVLRSLPAGAVRGRAAGPGERTSVEVVLAAPAARAMLGRSGHGGRTLAAAVLVGSGAGEAAGQLVLAASAGLPAATLIDIDAPDGTWAAAIQSCVARTLAEG
jgi:pyruvate/2-oxoglutarate dehydrogenase complex dihydrolipoamide dehydrogenase (E3) component